MIRSSLLLCLLVLPAIALAASTQSTSPPLVRELPRDGAVLGAATVDTTVLVGPWGSGAPVNGQFQSPGAAPAWNGWTSADLTEPEANHWHADTYNVVSGVYSAWCGKIDYPPCTTDPAGGYGNNWEDVMFWETPVASAAQPCTARVQAVANVDTELGYDYCYLQVVTATGVQVLWELSGYAPGVIIDETFVYQPADYVGGGADEVRVEFEFMSDGAASDEDCTYILGTAGAIQLDDVVITLSNGTGYSHDFEDGTLGDFGLVQKTGVGDYAKIWTNLRDVDPCGSSSGPQVAFIDDGAVVPETGGTVGLYWEYGPGGHVVNYSGGLADPGDKIHNVVVSPPLALPTGDDGLLLEYDLYKHLDVDFFCFGADCPTNIYAWEGVRSVATGDPADLEDALWQGPSFIFLGPDGYQRATRLLSEKLVPGATHVQVALGIKDHDQGYPLDTSKGSTPAPYFDNVRVVSFVRAGPDITHFSARMARDGFPESGIVDTADLGTNSVRFDMIADPNWFDGKATFIPGDSLVVQIVPRDGAVVTGTPRLHYRLFRNAVFDPYRTSGLPDLGSVDMVNPSGFTWSADLPDTGFLFPGDRLHYYFRAEDDLGGDIRASILPADTTGFSFMRWTVGWQQSYDFQCTFRALPNLQEVDHAPGTLARPSLLVVLDSSRIEDQQAWTWALTGAGYYEYGWGWIRSNGYDVYASKTTSPEARVLSTAATAAQLAGYDEIIYAGGSDDTRLEVDLPLLEGWLLTGGKDLMFSGARIAGDLDAFSHWTGTSRVADNIVPLIGDQLVPRVKRAAGDTVLNIVDSWLAHAGCPDLPAVEAVSTTGDAERLAEYLDPAGNPGAYPYAAMVMRSDPGTGSRVVTLPWDLTRVETDPLEGTKIDATVAARARLIDSVLNKFGMFSNAHPVTVPAASAFAITAHPNPFNPSTTLSYTVEKPGRLRLAIYDVRGALVATLVDAHVETSGSVDWRGTDNGGASVASGLYFYEARMNGQTKTGKLALIK